jgi:hypothetical protein
LVFHDSSLKEMATRLPRNKAEFRSIEGVGDKKLEKYGDIFLREIDVHCRKGRTPERDSPAHVQGSSPDETAETESKNSSPEISRPDYEIAFDSDSALTDEQELDVEGDLRIKYDSIIEKLNRLEQQVDELKLAIGEIKDCIVANGCTDSVPKRTELINQRQKN